MSERLPWLFVDPETLEEYLWEINPDDFDIGFEKNMGLIEAAPGGRALMMEGHQQVSQINFSGSILVQDQYDAMMAWFSKRYALQLVDDLNRTFTIYILNFRPKRVRSNEYPWRHTYQCEAIILEDPS